MAKKKAADKKQKLENMPQHEEDPRRIFADRLFVIFGKEHFVLAVQSGNSMDRQYALTPGSAERLAELLTRKVAEFKAAQKTGK